MTAMLLLKTHQCEKNYPNGTMDAVFYQFFRNAVHNEFSFPDPVAVVVPRLPRRRRRRLRFFLPGMTMMTLAALLLTLELLLA